MGINGNLIKAKQEETKPKTDSGKVELKPVKETINKEIESVEAESKSSTSDKGEQIWRHIQEKVELLKYQMM